MKARGWAVILLAALWPGAGPGPDVAASSGTVVVYTTISQDVASRFASAFSARHPQVRAEVLRSGGSEMERRLLAEIETGGIRADLLWVSDPPFLLSLRDRGYLQPYRAAEAHLVPPALRDPGGHYTAVRVINTLIAVNTTLIPPRAAPRRWADFPRYGKTAVMPNPMFSGSVFIAVSALVREFGWEWFQQARREGVTVLRSNSDVARALAAREFGVAITLDTVAYRLIQDGAPLSLVWPEEGVMSIPDLAAIPRSARNVEGARLFLDYLLSKAGQQELVALVSNPVRGDVSPPQGLPRTADVRALSVPYRWAGVNAPEIRRKFEEIMLR